MSPTTAERRRIDVHHHIAPPAYLAAVGPDINPPLRTWSLAKAVEDMDQADVATAIVSITQIAMRLSDPERIRRLARDCNEYAARMVADHRGRFGMFVALPLPDIEGSLREIEYGLDQLKADGVGLYTSYHDAWLGDPLFEPLFEELNRRKRCPMSTRRFPIAAAISCRGSATPPSNTAPTRPAPSRAWCSPAPRNAIPTCG